MEKRISPISARFASEETEAAYQSFIFEGDWRNNIYVIVAGLAIYALYITLDIGAVSEWRGAAVIRLSAVGVCAALLVAAYALPAKFLKEFAPAIIFIIVGLGLNLIMYLYTDLDDAYYVGLVQKCVFACFVLRISFFKTVAVMGSYIVGFSTLSSIKYGYDAANVQIVVLVTMAIVCGIGSYLLQKIRRFDFHKTLIIEGQNKQLKVLLEDAQRDNDRKLAAMNLLVHFVKTPLHQINGFSDIVMNSLDRDDGRTSFDEGVAGARYIKDATANLSKSVNSLLTYHRLDDLERQREYEDVDVTNEFTDFADFINDDMELKKEGEARVIRSMTPAVRTAFECMAKYYNEVDHGASKIELSLSTDKFGAQIILCDNGRVIGAEEFAEKTKPLTKIDNYLTSAGSEMPMLLRTTARALELCGGAFRQIEAEEGNAFVMTLRDMPKEAELDNAAAA